MLKVLHIVSGDLWAGAEVMCYHLLKGLASFPDTRLYVVVHNEGELAAAVRKLGLPCYLVNEEKASFLRNLFSTKAIISSIQPDIIHSHRYRENILACLAAMGANHAKLVSTQHGMPEAHHGHVTLKDRVKSALNYQVLSRKFDRVVAVSTDIRNCLVKNYGLSGDIVEVILNGVEVGNSFAVKRHKEHFVIGSAGRFFPVKDYPMMVKIAGEVCAKYPQIRFELAGEGPGFEDIRTLIQDLGLNEVFRLVGFVENVSEFYQGLDLYLNTSLHEGIPMSVLEAMSFELPVIGPEVGGLREIIREGVDGFLVKDRDPKSFAERCVRLFENGGMRDRMGAAARERVVDNFSFDRMAWGYRNLYLKCLTGTNPEGEMNDSIPLTD